MQLFDSGDSGSRFVWKQTLESVPSNAQLIALCGIAFSFYKLIKCCSPVLQAATTRPFGFHSIPIVRRRVSLAHQCNQIGDRHRRVATNRHAGSSSVFQRRPSAFYPLSLTVRVSQPALSYLFELLNSLFGVHTDLNSSGLKSGIFDATEKQLPAQN